MNALSDILDTLERHPGAPLCELARRSGWAPPTVKRWVHALTEAGDVERVPGGYRLVRRPAKPPPLGLRYKRAPKVLDVDDALVRLLTHERHTVGSASAVTSYPAYMVRDRLSWLACLGIVSSAGVWHSRHSALGYCDPMQALAVARCVSTTPRTAGWISERAVVSLPATRRILHALAEAGAVACVTTSPQTWMRA